MPINITSPWVGRSLFLTCLVAMAVILGVSAWLVTTRSEQRLTEQQFHVLATQALGEFTSYVERKRWSLVAMSSMVAELQPDPEQWPFVFIPNFEVIVTQLLLSTSGNDMVFAPFVPPEQRQEWLDFAYTYYNTTREPEPFPPGTAVSPFGIWGTHNGTKFASTNGTFPNTNSPYSFLAPIFHLDEGVNRFMLYDHRTEERRRRAIDGMVSCAETSPEKNCTGLSEIVTLLKYESDGPASIIYQYVQPRGASSPKGMVASPLVWIDVMRDGLALSQVHGMNVVLTERSQIGDCHFTYSIVDGKPVYQGVVHHRGESYMDYQYTIKLTGENAFVAGSPEYIISLYPNSAFEDSFDTNVPELATTGAILVVVLTSLFFLFYDCVMVRKVHHQTALLQAKRQFMRFVSHEVRTPINSISMGMRLMQEEMATALGLESAHELEGRMIQESQQLLGGAGKVLKDTNVTIPGEKALDWFGLTRDILVNSQVAADVLSDFLDFDKVQSGSLQLEWAPVPIWELLVRTVQEFKLPADAKRIAFSVVMAQDDRAKDLEGGLFSQWPAELRDMSVMGDPGRLTQVIRNLCSNALKFSPAGSAIQIKLEWTTTTTPTTTVPAESREFDLLSGKKVTLPRTGELCISVADHGVGMSQNQLDKLFTKFQQFNVNELQAGKGSGLGLHISKGIMEQHGGSLTAESAGLGQGATFIMALPLYPTMNRKSTMDTVRESESTESSHKLEALSILVVDDSDFNRKFLSRLLCNNGHQVTQAEDGLVAVERVKESLETDTPFDTILLDYEMPKMNGPDAAKAIRALHCDAYIVAVTGNMLQEDIQLFLSCGANTVLGKPLQMPKLEQLWLENRVGQSNL